MLTVYGKPDCSQCLVAKKLLTEHAVMFEYVDLSNDATSLTLVKNLGFKSLPAIVGSESEVIGGLKELKGLLMGGAFLV